MKKILRKKKRDTIGIGTETKEESSPNNMGGTKNLSQPKLTRNELSENYYANNSIRKANSIDFADDTLSLLSSVITSFSSSKPSNSSELKERELGHTNQHQQQIGCHLCKKQLNGMCIFSYKEKAVCSISCRDKLKNENRKQKWRMEKMALLLGCYALPKSKTQMDWHWNLNEMVRRREQRGSSFMSHCCCICKRCISGDDIFMYREKTYCSNKCRRKRIKQDFRKEKCKIRATEPGGCSAPMMFLADLDTI